MRHRAITEGSCILVLLCTLFCLSTPSSSGEEQPLLKILGASDTEGLKISTTSSVFKRSFFVESMNKAAVKDLRISVTPFVGPDSQLLETSWTVDGKPGSTTVQPVSGLGSAKLEINASLAKEGVYTGYISLIYEGKRVSVPIVVTRTKQVSEEQPILKIRGASDTEGLKISTTSSVFKRPFFVDSMNKATVTDLRISVEEFTGPDSQRVETNWTVDGKPGSTTVQPLSGLGSARFDISASLTKEGVYTGSISLIYDDKRVSVPIVVTRSRQGPTIKILELTTVRSTSPWYAQPDLWMTVEETGGLNLILGAPQLTALVLKEGDKAKIQAQYDGVSIFTDKWEPVDQSLTIGPNQTKRLRMRISNLGGTGEFAGTVRVGAADFVPVEQGFTIFVKKSWGVAALFIFLGVLGSYLVTQYCKKDRPQILLARRVLQISGAVEKTEARFKDLTNAEKGVLDSFRSWLEDLYSEVDAGTAKEPAIEAVLVEIDGKLSIFPLWVNSRRRMDAVQPPEIVVALRPKLDEVESKLSEKGTSAEGVGKLRNALVELAASITGKVRDDLLARIKQLEDEVKKTIGGSSGAPADRLESEVLDEIEAAEQKAKSTDLVEAVSLFDKARRVYASLLAAELASKVASDPRPEEIPEGEWAGVVQGVTNSTDEARRATDPERAIDAYQTAYSVYLRPLVEALHKRAVEGIPIVEGIGAIPADKREGFKKDLRELDRLLDGAKQKLRLMHVSDAAKDYDEARKKMDGIVNGVKTIAPGTKMSQAREDKVTEAHPAVVIPVRAGELRTEQAAERAARIKNQISDLLAKMKRHDKIFALGILIISVLLGLKLLWVDDPTWGGAKAYLTAVLWGLGLHQVSGAAFDGLAGLIEKWSK
jgi:hypothetical protein